MPQAPPQPVPADGQATHSWLWLLSPAATAKAESIFPGLAVPHFGHFSGKSFFDLISTSKLVPHFLQLYSYMGMMYLQ
jgi:hypothetical protein